MHPNLDLHYPYTGEVTKVAQVETGISYLMWCWYHIKILVRYSNICISGTSILGQTKVCKFYVTEEGVSAHHLPVGRNNRW